VLFAATLLKSTDAIAKSSIFAMVCIIIAVIAVIVYFFIFLAKNKYDVVVECVDAAGK